MSAGRIPLSITSWLESDKLFLKKGELEITVVERGASGNVLSSETLTLQHESTALESAQILSETRQIYRWSDKDRLILGNSLSIRDIPKSRKTLGITTGPRVELTGSVSFELANIYQLFKF